MNAVSLVSMRASLLLVSLALGCAGQSAAPVDAAMPDDAYDGGPPPGVEIGLRADGAVFTPWHDGETVPLVWGLQGGVMVTPAVAIDGHLVSATDPTLEISITNIDPATGMPMSFPGYGPVRGIFARLDQRLVNGPIQDQLGWTDMAGQHVRLRAHVGGMGLSLDGEVEVVLGSAGPGPRGGGCTDAMPCFDGADGGLPPSDPPDAGVADGG